ncbi:hypothetical protein [Pseudonocardia sp. TRM90224]|uniref:hypothetical protein n=1 Tax=Pseudonocardia sp. TRM90224 TaxID=2812678 RepID=UPI001E37D119|nr:hypothetical protein [Pseudonocardia sp. TRM90224]
MITALEAMIFITVIAIGLIDRRTTSDPARPLPSALGITALSREAQRRRQRRTNDL